MIGHLPIYMTTKYCILLKIMKALIGLSRWSEGSLNGMVLDGANEVLIFFSTQTQSKLLNEKKQQETQSQLRPYPSLAHKRGM
jgi:hypothetical protein